MRNPILDMMSSQAQPSMQGGMPGMAGMLQQFMQFKNQFQGDPKQKVMQMLQSGQISQHQYEQAINTAKMLENMFSQK